MTSPVPAEPATPAEALRWAAERVDIGPYDPVLDDPRQEAYDDARRHYAAELRRWADELDAARATDPGPAPTTWALPNPPAAEITEVWDVEGVRWERQQPGIVLDRWVADEDATFESVRTWGSLLRRGPLSSVPPGTEAGQ